MVESPVLETFKSNAGEPLVQSDSVPEAGRLIGGSLKATHRIQPDPRVTTSPLIRITLGRIPAFGRRLHLNLRNQEVPFSSTFLGLKC